MDLNNSLLKEWNTPFGIPPFTEINPEQFLPAIEKAISLAQDEIDSIINNSNEPDFVNTIEALESTGKLLNLIAATHFNLNSAETSQALQKSIQKVSPILTRFANSTTLNRELFKKVKKVYDSAPWEELSTEESVLLREKYKNFRNGGAELSGKERDRYKQVTEKLSKLTVKFEENLLAETNSFYLHITRSKELDGLPDGLKEQAAEEALKRDKKGWVFTLHSPSYIPFMQRSKVRKLRREMYVAYSSRCYKENQHDNREIVKEIVNLRLELANLLGFESYADFVLEDRMASTKKEVNSFLRDLYKAARPFAEKDLLMVRKFAESKGHTSDFEKWDWAFYSESLKRERYSIDDEILRPYFNLESVEKAVFGLAESLYDISFTEVKGVPIYHTETKVFEVKDNMGNHIAILMVDYHPREGKNSGAWMTAYRDQYNIGKDIRPLISIVMNFSKATAGKPALLTHNELTTLLHEFGHALHGMLSKCKYASISGTNVKRDFVELPSQIMENWAYEKEWLNSWAVHYKTGDKLPEELVDKIRDSLIYNEGFACNRQLSFGMLDMAWHTIREPYKMSVGDFEQKVISDTELFNSVEGTNQSCAFGHLFSGGYAAGYYGYKWAEVLDADAFSLFMERGIFDKKTARSFKENILEKGGSDEPMNLYKSFRGSEPSIDALLKRSGFLKQE